MMTTLIQVAFGGAIGASLRYLTNIGAMRWFGPGFPYGTMIVNVTGSFVMGVLVVVFAQKGGMRYAPFALTGALGGFTTFSAFSLDSLTLFERGQTGLALAYIVGSVGLSLGGIAAGVMVTRGIFA